MDDPSSTAQNEDEDTEIAVTCDEDTTLISGHRSNSRSLVSGPDQAEATP